MPITPTSPSAFTHSWEGWYFRPSATVCVHERRRVKKSGHHRKRNPQHVACPSWSAFVLSTISLPLLSALEKDRTARKIQSRVAIGVPLFAAMLKYDVVLIITSGDGSMAIPCGRFQLPLWRSFPWAPYVPVAIRR